MITFFIINTIFGMQCSAQVIVKVKHYCCTEAYHELDYPALVTWKFTDTNVCKKGSSHYDNRDHTSVEPDPITPQFTCLSNDFKRNSYNEWQSDRSRRAFQNTCNRNQVNESLLFQHDSSGRKLQLA
jgi:hypothetical protein